MDEYERCSCTDLSENQQNCIPDQIRDRCIELGLPVPSNGVKRFLISDYHGNKNRTELAKVWLQRSKRRSASVDDDSNDTK